VPSGELRPESLPDHTDRLYRSALALSGSPADAEDLVQETFARVLARPRTVGAGGELGYLMRVLRNTWIDLGRARAARPREVAGESIEWLAGTGGDPAGTALEVRLAFEAMRDLTGPQREAIVAVDVAGLSYREAARSLRVRQGTLMSRLARARDAVALHMEGRPGPTG
jgi:RNA polymerase sigma-70 factor, ECF subfamily